MIDEIPDCLSEIVRREKGMGDTLDKMCLEVADLFAESYQECLPCMKETIADAVFDYYMKMTCDAAAANHYFKHFLWRVENYGGRQPG